MIVYGITFQDEETGKIYTTCEDFDHSVIAESLEKYGDIKLQYIEGMIEEGYNLDFLYYDFDFETNMRALK